jgi:serine/threonine protein kinase/WD40 repeat protein
MTYCLTICESCGDPLPDAGGGRCCPQCAAGGATAALPRDERGTRLALTPQAKTVRGVPGHLLGEIIGAGGMGEVHRARQGSLHRDVALKLLVAERLGCPEDRDRFLREARVLAQLDHPNIVPIYDYGTDAEGRCFYTMKMVRGRTLKAIVADVREGVDHWPLEKLLGVFRKVCDAIAFAHSRGVLHRDLKPDNVMVGEFGEVLVMDWGLAGEIKAAPAVAGSALGQRRGRAIDSDVELTMQGEVLGTPQYMAPEQASAQGDLDERADIYALGGILYTILSLRPPVRKADVQAMLESVRTGQIEPFSAEPEIAMISARKQRIPPALLAVVRKAMALERAARFASVEALAADVDAHLAGYAPDAQALSPAGQLWLLIKRHRTVSIALLVLAMVSAGFVVQLMDSERRAQQNAQDAFHQAGLARQNEESARRNEDAARQAERSAQASEAATRIALADSAYAANDTPQMRAALDSVPQEFRDSTWHYLKARADNRQGLFELNGDSFFIGCAAHPLRPGVFAVSGSANHPRIAIVEAATGKVLADFKQRGGWVRGLAYTPDGKKLALARFMGGGLSIHDAETGVELQHWASPEANLAAFLPDGQRLLLSFHGGSALWDTVEGRVLWQSPLGGWHWPLPDGERFVSVSARKVRLHALADGRELAVYEHRQALHWASALSPDGTVLLTAHNDGGIIARRLSDGMVLFDVPTADSGPVHRMAFTPDGRRFVVVNQLQESVQCVQLCDAATGRLLRWLRGGAGGIESICIHPQSSDLVVAGARTAAFALPQNRVPRWQFSAGRINTAFLGHDDLFLTPTTHSSLDALDLRTGEVVWRPARPLTNRIAVSHDGRTGVGQIGGQEKKREFSIFREESGRIREIGRTRYGTDAGSLVVNVDGTRLAVSGTWGGLVCQTLEDGAELPWLEQRDIRFIFDLTWHGTDPKRLLGIFARHAFRGTPGSEEWLIAWDTDTGRIVASQRHPTAMHTLVAEPGGQRLAEGGGDKFIRIRDANTLGVQREFRAHDGAISALAWHPHRPILASGSTDRSVRLWNVETGELLEEIHIGLREPSGLRFSPSGRRLACTTNYDKTLVWELEAEPDSLVTETTKR